MLNWRIHELVVQVRRQQLGISDARLADIVSAALCPVVASMSGLSTSAKRIKLMQLDAEVLDEIAATALPSHPHVALSVPLTPGVAQQVNNAAAARHQTPGAYTADLIARQSGQK